MKLETHDTVTECLFEIGQIAFYHGANSMLDVLHKSFGDNPEIAAFIKLLTDELNADMAATIGG